MAKIQAMLLRQLPVLAGAVLLLTGCAVKRFAVNKFGDALAGGGTTWASDDDPELIESAAPFSLKLMESLLAESPRHRGLLLAAASGFTQYGYAFVQQEADQIEERDVAAARAMRDRARRLYLRARDYGLRGLDVRYAGFTAELRRDPKTAAARVRRKDDVPYLYWTAASWGAAIAVSKDRPDLVADIPVVEALIDRALALDEGFEAGAIHSFLVSYELVRPGVKPDEAIRRARQHYERATALGGQFAVSPLVTWAEQVCVQQQDRREFERLLHAALAVDADAHPSNRLVNVVMQRRARWLLGRVDELFLE